MSKKVALLGNMNNNFFNLCRFLRDRGYDAVLYIFPYDPKHFLPEADSYYDSYKGYVKTLNWGNPYELYKVSASEIRQELAGYDFIIGSGTAPAYLKKAGMKLDLLMPYGTDLIHYPFFNLLRPQKLIGYVTSLLWSSKREEIAQLPSKPTNIKGYLPFVWNQRKGIRETRTAAFPTSGQDIYAISLRALKFKNTHYSFSVPLVYEPQYNAKSIQDFYGLSKLYNDFNKIRKERDFLIFHNCRHCWKYEKDPHSFKGNDRLLEGFASFIKEFEGKASIITFAYGTDYMESKRLAEELGIAQHIHWFPVCDRKELLVGMSLADLVVGNLSDASWSTYGVVYEALTLSKPIMHHRDDHLYAEETLYPMINAYNSDMVAKSLLHYSKHKKELLEIGQKANVWFMKNCINDPLQKIIDLINTK